MIREHYEAVAALLTADPDLAGKVHASALVSPDGKLQRSTYMIVYPTPPDELNDERTAVKARVDSKATYHYEVRAVSVSALGCADLVDRLLTRLVDATPVVEGRKVSSLELDTVDRVLPDTNVSPPLYYCDVTFTFISRKDVA